MSKTFLENQCISVAALVINPFLAISAALWLPKARASEISAVNRIVIIQGVYGYDESGELYFLPSKDTHKTLPLHEAIDNIAVGFSNSDAAIFMLGIRKVIYKVNLRDVCGVKGRAEIAVSTFVHGEGPSRPWYTVRLERVLQRSAAQLIPCPKPR